MLEGCDRPQTGCVCARDAGRDATCLRVHFLCLRADRLQRLAHAPFNLINIHAFGKHCRALLLQGATGP